MTGDRLVVSSTNKTDCHDRIQIHICMSSLYFQAQASVVGFLASLVAMIMGWIPDGSFDIHHALLLCASSMLTAAVASFVLGKSIMYEKKN